MKIKYEAFDGQLFDSQEDCEKYESNNVKVDDRRFQFERIANKTYYCIHHRREKIIRVKFIEYYENTSIEEKYDQVTGEYILINIIESYYKFEGIDDKSIILEIWRPERMPTSNISDLFGFDISR